MKVGSPNQCSEKASGIIDILETVLQNGWIRRLKPRTPMILNHIITVHPCDVCRRRLPATSFVRQPCHRTATPTEVFFDAWNRVVQTVLPAIHRANQIMAKHPMTRKVTLWILMMTLRMNMKNFELWNIYSKTCRQPRPIVYMLPRYPYIICTSARDNFESGTENKKWTLTYTILMMHYWLLISFFLSFM